MRLDRNDLSGTNTLAYSASSSMTAGRKKLVCLSLISFFRIAEYLLATRTWVEHLIWLVLTANINVFRVKHSSLFGLFVSYEVRGFITLIPWLNVIIPFTPIMSKCSY